jgi:phospholipid transport system substrate-binding protein
MIRMEPSCPKFPLYRRAILALTLSICLTLALVLSAASARAADAEAPLKVVKTELNQALTIVHNQQMPVAERRRELRALAERDLDLAFMARESLGDHWNEIAPAQRNEFVGLFTAFIEDAYLTQIQDYTNLQIDASQARLIPPNYAEVNATITQPHEDPMPVTFRLDRQGDKWLVYDVDVEGVSMVRNYRAQFNREINDHGLPRLLDDLRAKKKQLDALTGQP